MKQMENEVVLYSKDAGRDGLRMMSGIFATRRHGHHRGGCVKIIVSIKLYGCTPVHPYKTSVSIILIPPPLPV